MALILIALLGCIDYLTGYEISLSIFYLLPVAIAAWYAGRWHGILVSIAGGLSWFLVDVMGGHVYSSPFIMYWNACTSLGFFLVVTLTLARLKDELKRERKLSKTDFLTGIANPAYFSELLTWEINRSQRNKNPLTLAYIDCDDFKSVNDRFGHHAGNGVLRLIAAGIQDTVRETDLAGRLGGDEFAILFPETGPKEADPVIRKVQNQLLKAMQKGNWPITFSIGVVTYIEPPDSADEAIQAADRLMYEAKHAGKNMIRHEVLGSKAAEEGTVSL